MSPSRILVVEDEAVVAMEIEERLQLMGYDPVGQASTRDEALSLVQKRRPDLVLMDIHLRGGKDGIDAAGEILHLYRVPSIFLTAYSDDSTLARAKLAGPHGYILKPFDDRELKSAIEIALHRHAAEEEILRLNRLYDVLSQVGQAVARIRTSEELLPRICRLVVERGSVDLAWIGRLDAETSCLHSEACFGGEGHGIDLPDFFANGPPGGQGSPGRAIRSGRPFLCNDCADADCLYPQEKKPAMHGFRSCGSFPLFLQGQAWGAFTLCATEPQFFKRREIELLEEVALNISFALDTMEAEKQKRRAEEELRASEQRFRDVVEATGEFIWEMDAPGRLTYLSGRVEQILGYSPAELVGRRPYDCIEEVEARDKESFLQERALEKSAFRNLECVMTSKSGRQVLLNVTGTPILGVGGEIMGFRGAALDITASRQAEAERAKMQTQLRQAQKLEAIGTLAGGIAHDFNNILSPIIGYAEMALEDISEPGLLRGDIQQILTAGYRAKELVKQILTFGRLSDDDVMGPTDIGLAIKEAMKLLRASLPSSVELRQNIHRGTAVADPTQIHQIVFNLCSNASHAMGGKGTLDVSLEEVALTDEELTFLAFQDLLPGSYMKLRVADTGHGMSEETMHNIFDPYFTTKAIGEGTGLGLAVVHGIVMKHGGRIKVHSTPGEGSVFEIFLPAVKPVRKFAANAPESPTGGHERIMVVDDEPSILALSTSILGKLGYDVTTRSQPEAALELFLTDPQGIDLVLTDYTMPHITGDELAATILQVRPEMPILLMTGYNEKMGKEDAQSKGFFELIQKPFDRKDLAGAIRAALDARTA